MKKMNEHILRTTKEIIVKFIEMGRLSPSNVNETFQDIYSGIHSTVMCHSNGNHSNLKPSSKDQEDDQ